MAFTKQQARVAALWWAQYLPGAHKRTAEIKNNVLDQAFPDTIDEKLTAIDAKQLINATLDMAAAGPEVTAAQYDTFVDTLADKIMQLPDKRLLYENSRYKKLGSSSLYQPPHEVIEATQTAGIDVASGTNYFPWKTEMLLLDNGQIHVKDEVIRVGDAPKDLDTKKLDFSNAPYVIAKAGEVVVAEVPPGTTLYTADSYFEKAPPVKTEVKDGGYVNASQGLVKEGQLSVLRNLDAKRLIATSPEMADQLPMKITSFSKEHPALGETDYASIPGPVTYEDQGNGHYRHRSRPLRVIEVQEAATVGYGDTTRYVDKGDWLLFDEKSKKVKAMPAKQAKESEIDFYLASPDGTILSTDKFEPGIELPALGENAPRKSTGQGKRPPRGGG